MPANLIDCNMKRIQNIEQNITEAATVILARERAGRLQIYLLKRSVKSGFMAGNYVFPGGMLDPEDRNIDLFESHSDLNLGAIARRLGGDLSAEKALTFCVAAIRETLEEAGVFFAHHQETHFAQMARVCDLRQTDTMENGWFAKLVAGSEWRLTLTALSRWSRWITPELMKRRFDARFFLAEMPAGQYCQPDSRETVQGLWVSPEEGLAGNMDGTIPLSPPTLVTLHELLMYQSLTEVQAESRRRPWGQAVLPRLVPLDQGAVIVEPWDPHYREQEIRIDPDGLPNLILPVGKTFSRIWYDGRLWRPVKV
jgi:8-oxo-dGTP pyrophosphatase MutT (NUDIX family)